MSVRKIKLTMGSKIIGHAVMKSYPDHDGKTFYNMPTYKLTVEGTDGNGKAQSKEFVVLRFGIQKKAPTSAARVVGLANQQTHTIKRWISDYHLHSVEIAENGAWQVYGSFLIHDGPDDPETEAYGSIGCIEICRGPSGFSSFNDYIISLSGSTKGTRLEKLTEIGASGKLVITYQKAARPPLSIRRIK